MNISLGQLKMFLNRSSFRLLYYRYQEYLTPLMVIVVSVILFATIVIHQFQGLLSSQSQAMVLGQKISVLESNINTLSQINETDQNEQLQAVLYALPEEKDFTGILQAVASASNSTGVGIGDYSFQVGELSTTPIGKTPSSITLTLVIQGDAVSMKRFLEELSRTTPLSNVSSISTSRLTSSVVLSFFYKGPTAIKIDYTKPVATLSGQQSQTLEAIKRFEAPQNIDFAPVQSSPSSALEVF